MANIMCPCLLLQLALEKDLNLKQIKFFVIDECDKVLEKLGELPCS
jgi:superfamily II DNA/RNA helicase